MAHNGFSISILMFRKMKLLFDGENIVYEMSLPCNTRWLKKTVDIPLNFNL